MNRSIVYFFFVLVIFLIVRIPCTAEKFFTIDHISKPTDILVIDNRLYITDQKSVQMYSLKEKKWICQVGKPGLGTGEYLENPYVVFQPPDKILILSPMSKKLLTFTLDGEFISEKRFRMNINTIEPLGPGYVASTLAYFKGAEKKCFDSTILLNADLKKIKEIDFYEFPNPLKEYHVLPFSPWYKVYDGKLFLSKPREGFVFDVFGINGERIYRIKHKYNEVPVTEESKSLKLAQLRSQKREIWDNIKDIIYFPDYFPSVRDFVISGDKIYARTWIEKKNKIQFLVTALDDGKGSETRSKWLPYSGGLYAIENGWYYYLKETEPQDTWELHTVPVEKVEPPETGIPDERIGEENNEIHIDSTEEKRGCPPGEMKKQPLTIIENVLKGLFFFYPGDFGFQFIDRFLLGFNHPGLLLERFLLFLYNFG